MEQNLKESRNILQDTSVGPGEYAEPSCLLGGTPYGMTPEVKAVPLRRIIEKLDEYQSRKDTNGALRHLKYWLEEARLGHDRRGQLGIYNELIGFYRKNGKKDEAFQSIEEALKLVDELQLSGTVTSGTTCINAATALYTFGEYERSVSLFEKAKEVYESNPDTDRALLGGLYNNMGLTNAALRRFGKAEEFYQKALMIMEDVPGGRIEQAITYLNMADMKDAEKGTEEAESEIAELLSKAERLLDDTWDHLDGGTLSEKGYYAFVCESCASVFSYYGYFITAKELNRRAWEIYEGNAAVQGIL